MQLTTKMAMKMLEENGGNLDLRYTYVTGLPEGLMIPGYLDLSNTPITTLPKNIVVGDWIDLSNSAITSLPENLTVAEWLDLSYTSILNLPKNLTVGEWIDLSNTSITSLPEDLVVGKTVYCDTDYSLSFHYHQLKEGCYVPNKYIYADGNLTHVKCCKIVNGYTVYYGKIKGKNVISDGTFYAQCNELKYGIAEIAFKKVAVQGTRQYKHLTKESVIKASDAITMYRIITGVDQQHVNDFVGTIKNVKEYYTVEDIIAITQEQLGSKQFAAFFENNN